MKSGFVCLIGKPNVGKSTILNLLSNRKVSIVTPKAQTTRNNIISLIDSEKYQIVLEDTPGLHTAKSLLGQNMNHKVKDAIKDSDVIVLILDATNEISETYLKGLLDKKIDIVVLNKIDLLKLPEVEKKKEEIKSLLPLSKFIELCAKDKFNIDLLLEEIIKLLPENEKFYPDPNVLKNDVFMSKEIIREQMLLNLNKEVPHNLAIFINDIKRKKESILINSTVLVNKDSHKGIVIGKNGKMLKKIGTLSRLELEKYFKKRIYLNLFVKVKKDWINSSNDIKNLLSQ